MDKTLTLIPADGGSGDFPVLKAFQEYIDAEQAKARKRMLGLSIFFVVLLIVVVITFVMILTMVVNRNQALSDRLLDYALRERETPQAVQQVPVVQQSPDQNSIARLIEKFERDQAQMKAAYEQQQKEAKARAAAAEALREAELQAVKKRLEEERLKAQKESERQEAILRHRRKLYPEYYNQQVALPAAAPATVAPSPRPAATAPATQPKSQRTSPTLSEIKPLTYFNIDDEDDVPFIIDTSQKSKQ